MCVRRLRGKACLLLKDWSKAIAHFEADLQVMRRTSCSCTLSVRGDEAHLLQLHSVRESLLLQLLRRLAYSCELTGRRRVATGVRRRSCTGCSGRRTAGRASW